MFCPNCGVKNEDGIAHCACCGASLKGGGPEIRYSTPSMRSVSSESPAAPFGNTQGTAPVSGYETPQQPFVTPPSYNAVPESPAFGASPSYGIPTSYGSTMGGYGAPAPSYPPPPPSPVGPTGYYGGPTSPMMFGGTDASATEDEPLKGMAIPGFILGIVTAVLSFFWIAFLTAPPAIVLSAIPRSKGNTSKMTLWGLILGIIGAANCLLFQIIYLALDW